MPLHVKQRWNEFIDDDPCADAVWGMRCPTRIFCAPIISEAPAPFTNDRHQYSRLPPQGTTCGKEPCDESCLTLSLDHSFQRFEATTVIAALVPQCEGVVLELGPGMGNENLRLFLSGLKGLIFRLGYNPPYKVNPRGTSYY
ncbi:hypothetical protein MY3296_000934 [Beauveria thailandica]